MNYKFQAFQKAHEEHVPYDHNERQRDLGYHQYDLGYCEAFSGHPERNLALVLTNDEQTRRSRKCVHELLLNLKGDTRSFPKIQYSIRFLVLSKPKKHGKSQQPK